MPSNLELFLNQPNALCTRYQDDIGKAIAYFQARTPIGRLRALPSEELYETISNKLIAYRRPLWEKRIKRPEQVETWLKNEVESLLRNEEDMDYLAHSPFTLILDYNERKYEKEVQRYIASQFKRTEDRKEALQMFVLHFQKNLGNYDEQRASVQSFIFSLLKYFCLKYKTLGAKRAYRMTIESNLPYSNDLETESVNAGLPTVSSGPSEKEQSVYDSQQFFNRLDFGLKTAFPRKKDKAVLLIKIYVRARLTAADFQACWPTLKEQYAMALAQKLNKQNGNEDKELFEEIARGLENEIGYSVQGDTLRKEASNFFQKIKQLSVNLLGVNSVENQDIQDLIKIYFDQSNDEIK